MRLALSVALEDDEPSEPSEPALALTPREADVLRLLMESYTDREIADALFLSPRTVSWHVRHILDKLGANSRRDAVARARKAGLHGLPRPDSRAPVPPAPS